MDFAVSVRCHFIVNILLHVEFISHVPLKRLNERKCALDTKTNRRATNCTGMCAVWRQSQSCVGLSAGLEGNQHFYIVNMFSSHWIWLTFVMPLCKANDSWETPAFVSHSSQSGLKKEETTLRFAKWNDHIVSYNISIKRITELSSLLCNMSPFWLWIAPCIQ